MSTILELRKEIDLLKQRKTEAQRKNHAEAAKHRLSRKDIYIPDINSDEKVAEENIEYHHEDLPKDPMDWSAAQWAKKDWPQQSQTQSSGYKNLSSLAYATYAKETAKRSVDLAKYETSKSSQAPGTGNYGIATNQPAPEDVEAVVKGLQEASERKQKRRTDDVSDKQYINEKNRQFNMKLDREYGA